MLPFSTLEKLIPRMSPGYVEKPKTIGELLIKKRIDLKLTKVEMAKKYGISVTKLSDWEKSRRTSQKNIESFMDLFAVF